MDEQRQQVRAAQRATQRLPEDIDFRALGLVVKCARELLRRTQAEAARQVSMSKSLWAQIENGHRFPDDHIDRMARSLSWSWYDLVDLADIPAGLPEQAGLAKRLVKLELRMKAVGDKLFGFDRKVNRHVEQLDGLLKNVDQMRIEEFVQRVTHAIILPDLHLCVDPEGGKNTEVLAFLEMLRKIMRINQQVMDVLETRLGNLRTL